MFQVTCPLLTSRCWLDFSGRRWSPGLSKLHVCCSAAAVSTVSSCICLPLPNYSQLHLEVFHLIIAPLLLKALCLLVTRPLMSRCNFAEALHFGGHSVLNTEEYIANHTFRQAVDVLPMRVTTSCQSSPEPFLSQWNTSSLCQTQPEDEFSFVMLAWNKGSVVCGVACDLLAE